MVGTDAQNKNTLDDKYICSVCSLVLQDPVQFNTCGHRLCQSCLDMQNGTIVKCAQCQRETPRDQVLIDRGFKIDMQPLPITCVLCNWTDILDNYQEHLDQSHPNPKCLYCDLQFTSINQLNEHKAYQCQKITVDCLLKDFGCHDQILRCELSNHYLSRQHQDSVLNVIDQMKSQLRDTQATTGIDIDYGLTQLHELNETIFMLGNGVEILNEDTQRLNNELVEQQVKLQSLIEKFSKVKLADEETNIFLEGVRPNHEILNQELVSLAKKIDDMQHVSYDGTFTWKIPKFHERMIDAQSERQTSIYSPPFYSSPTGYKMRARLYLNGDGNARQTHMSLFFVLMRGRNDPILKFPFNFKVTFCLYDQTPQQRHIIDSFRPDVRSSSFQRPRSEMNIASGIPKFCRLDTVQQAGNPYVQDDTMFIKVMVDFGDMPKTLLPYALTLNPGIPTNVQQEMIKVEKERRTQEQTMNMSVNNS